MFEANLPSSYYDKDMEDWYLATPVRDLRLRNKLRKYRNNIRGKFVVHSKVLHTTKFVSVLLRIF